MANILKEKSFEFAYRIIKVYQFLVNEKKEYIISKQLLRSGTAIGALVREANNAESDPDFVHKLSIAQKECDETLYWLELLSLSGYLTSGEFKNLSEYGIEIIRIIKSSIITTKNKIKNKKLRIHNS